MTTTFKIPTGLCDEMIDPTFPLDGAFYDEEQTQPSPLTGLNAWVGGALLLEPDDAGITDGQNNVDLTLRGPVTRWLGYAFGNPRMLPSEAAALLPLQPGDPNPFFQIVDAVEREGGKLSLGATPTALAEAKNVTRAEWLKPEYGQAAVMVGGDAIDLSVVFVFANEADLDADVPATFPQRTHQVPNDPEDPEAGYTEQVHTWRTWAVGNGHEPKQIGDNWYRFNTISYTGRLDASAWAGAGLTVISESDYLAIASANTPEP